MEVKKDDRKAEFEIIAKRYEEAVKAYEAMNINREKEPLKKGVAEVDPKLLSIIRR